jgi:hypothetical protein
MPALLARAESLLPSFCAKKAEADSSKMADCLCGIPGCKGHKKKAWNAAAPMRVPGNLLGGLYFHR